MKSLTKLFEILPVLLAAVFAASVTSCSSKENEPDQPTEEELILTGNITSDRTLKGGYTYKLDGEYIVESGATLNIEPGVKIVSIYDDKVDYILIKQGGKINAVGTAENPIIMTSEKEEPGSWGGIHICGYAHTNAEGGKGSSEIGGAPYGGNNDSDNSGVIKYVRLEYTGYAFDEEHEANGFTFYGVGNGTVVENCEAYKGSDDGFEFFGGSVNVRNLVSVNCSDDSFDWTEGWNGSGTNLVAYQEDENSLGYDCDCLIEADNNENNYAATPVSHPLLSNLILVGNGGSKQGVLIRRGSHVTISDAQIGGKAEALKIESNETDESLADGVSEFINVTISSDFINNSEQKKYTDSQFVNDGNSTGAEIPYSTLNEIISACPWMEGWTR